MNSLLELPMKAAEFLARISMRLAEAAADATSEWARAQRRARAPRPAPAPPPPATTTAPRTPRAPRADPTAPAPPPPVAASPAPPVAASPPPPVAAPPPAPELSPEPPIEVVPDLTRGEAARIREAEREAETTEDSPGAVVHVDEPWQGYKAMKAPEIIDRLRVSDDAVKAVVLLYEGSHRGRKTVLRAAGG
jgi:type IV secretory pathway VirB10-like protein